MRKLLLLTSATALLLGIALFTGCEGPMGPAGIAGQNGQDGKDGMDGMDGKDGSPDTPEQVRDKLSALVGEERIDASAIKNIENFAKTVGGMSRGFMLRVLGVKRGMINDINFAGSGVAYSSVNGQATVTITSGGASGAGNAYAWFVF